MLTTPITNTRFEKKIFTLLRNAAAQQPLADLDRIELQDVEIATVPALDYLDTSLVPEQVTTQLLGLTSNWIDLCSPDPLISGISKQVLILEVQYAAFCGIDHIIVEGPRLFYGDAAAGDVSKFARAIQDCLEVAPHTSFYIKLPMYDHPDVVEHASDQMLQTRDEYLDSVDHMKPQGLDLFGRWDAWNTVRTACKYSTRLFLGKNQNHLDNFSLYLPRWSCIVEENSDPFLMAIQILRLPTMLTQCSSINTQTHPRPCTASPVVLRAYQNRDFRKYWISPRGSWLAHTLQTIKRVSQSYHAAQSQSLDFDMGNGPTTIGTGDG